MNYVTSEIDEVLSWVQLKFPGFAFGAGKDMLRDTYVLYVYPRSRKDARLPWVGTNVLAAIDIERGPGDVLSEIMLTKLTLVCGCPHS